MIRLDSLIHRFKNIRKQSYLRTSYSKKIACIGIGSHSINNLYPTLNYHRVPIKYIVTKSEANARQIDENFDSVIGTTDIDAVLADDEISGVVICTQPKAHFSLVKKVLEADKHAFVEKPPCINTDQLSTLIEVEKQSKATCVVGFQKRYAPVYRTLYKYKRTISAYTHDFVTGGYPEGDPYVDLFIHPIDTVCHLFGKPELHSVLKTGNKNGETCVLQLIHPNKIIGSVHLSTAHQWNQPLERLVAHSTKGQIEATDSETLTLQQSQGQILGIPLEKVKKTSPKQIFLSHRTNFVPMIFNNQIYTSGYYDELKTFLSICENRSHINYSSLESCVDTFELLKTIQSHPYV